ncbi:MAG: hypothetical protein ACUVXD_09845 [Thermodesulfobacteriota bacterium]
MGRELDKAQRRLWLEIRDLLDPGRLSRGREMNTGRRMGGITVRKSITAEQSR